MEAGGAARAAFQSTAKPGFFMIRAVSDLADEAEAKPQDAAWRAYARDVAAAFTVGFLQSGPVTARPAAAATALPDHRPDPAAKVGIGIKVDLLNILEKIFTRERPRP